MSLSSSLKPIKLYGRSGPNPIKVGFILEELGIPYEVVSVQYADVKKPEYLAINPNGRLPAIHDPNTGITLWESGAIIEYLIEVYDKKHQLSFATGTPESFHAKQWFFFQTTGQGPYYGQAVWFNKHHHEKLPSAIERYAKEVNRVTSVLEGHLAEQKRAHGGTDGPWLVGNKLSYVDISFIQWQRIMDRILKAEEYSLDNFPHVKGWMDKMTSREAIKKVVIESEVPTS